MKLNELLKGKRLLIVADEPDVEHWKDKDRHFWKELKK